MDLSGVSSEPWDWPAEMRRVTRRFRGRKGVFVQFGDSLTLARPNVLWALSGPGHTSEESAFLRWAHAGENSERDGWYLATTPTVTDFRRSGYMLRGHLIVRKGMEVRAKVLEPSALRAVRRGLGRVWSRATRSSNRSVL